MNKKELLEKLQNNVIPADQVYVPLTYVVKLIEELEEATEDLELDEDVFDEIAGEINSEGISIVDSYDLTMNYREVELDDISFDTDAIAEIIKRRISESRN